MHSEDGRYWWDGSQWLPAWSADGFLWFDGTTWRPRSLGPAVPPPRRRRPWLVAGIVAGVVLVLGIAGIVGFGLFTYASADEVDWIELPEVSDAASAGCKDVITTIQRAGTGDIAAGNAAIDRLVARVEAVGDDAIDDDLPTREWLQDWRDLEAARSTVPFVVPSTEDGSPVTLRMIDAGPEPCEGAVTLATTTH